MRTDALVPHAARPRSAPLPSGARELELEAGDRAPIQRAATGGEVTRDAPLPADAGRAMPDDVVAKIGPALGIDARGVRVHESPVTSELGARAFAFGEDVWFAPGEFAPSTPEGLALIGHEVTHVQQQRDGRVAAPQGKGAPINADAGLEAEADRGGARLAAFGGGAGLAVTASAPARGAAIQRVVVPVDATRPTGAQMLALTLAALDRYARGQVDWHTNPNVSQQQHDQLRGILEAVRAHPALVGGCGTMVASTLVPVLAQDVPRRKLLSYAGAVTRARATVRLEATDTVMTAVAWGAALELLEAGLPGALLGQIVRPAQLRNLIADDKIAEFVAYATGDPRPTLHCDTGDEVDSALAFEARARLAAYQGRIPHVRNVHRFRPATLDRLRTNWGQAPGQKRLTVIAHSTFDDKGAFHRDRELDDVVAHGENHTLLIEGKASLAEVQAVITEIRRAFGEIAQVMFAGHGGARDMEMGGNLENRDGRQRPANGEAIDLDENADKTWALLDATIQALGDRGRIVFNACLTDSNHVDPDAIGAHDPRGDLLQALAANRSLSAATRARAQTLHKRIEVKGANGSFSGGPLMDDRGHLDLQSNRDPSLTASKAEYARTGADPTGAMRALLEVWSGDPRAAVEIARVRSLVGNTTWNGAVIEALYAIVVARYANDPKGIAYLADAASSLKKIRHADSADARRVRGDVSLAEWAVIAPRLAQSADFVDHAPLVVHQVSSLFAAGGDAAFLTAADGYTCATVARDELLKIAALEDRGALVRLIPPAANPTRGRLVLALMALIDDGARARGRDFLRPLGTAQGFGQVAVEAALGGYRSVQDVLELLGLAVANPVVNNVNANLDSSQSNRNDTYVRPLFARGTVARNADYVTDPPDGGPLDDHMMVVTMPANAAIAIVGEYTDPRGGRWYVFELDHQVGYIGVGDVVVA